jgi:alkyl hydroperoxide reductase subunit AhpF
MKTTHIFLALLLLLVPACGEKADKPEESLLKNKDRDFVKASMEGAEREAKILLFTSSGDCEFCDLTESFLGDIAAQSPLITLETLSLEEDGARAQELGIDKAPGIAILGKEDYGLRYYGFPTGFEFISFVETIRMSVDGDPSLEPETVEKLAGLQEPVSLTVFSTKS